MIHGALNKKFTFKSPFFSLLLLLDLNNFCPISAKEKEET
jgi:hypothetical protein